MPELPEVEAYRRYLEAEALGRPIADVRVLAPGSVRGVAPRALQDALRGRTLVRTVRRGKNLLAALDGGPWVAFHFGMTGRLQTLGRDEEPPRHDRVELVFRDGGRLAFVDQRRFGGVSLAEDAEAYFAARRLGPDALGVKPAEAARRLRERHGAVKAVLLDQRVLAGLGNEYADEALFRARIHPARRVEALSADELARLAEAVRRVLRVAVERRVSGRPLPEDWLIRHRKAGEACPVRGGGRVERITLAGRGTYYCDALQPPPAR